MSNYRTDTSEEEALFRSYPYALYYVQSPSTTVVSHANTVHNYNSSEPEPEPANAAAPALFSYSSSRGSNDSFPSKKINTIIKYSQDLDQDGLLENGEEGRRDLVKKNAVDLDGCEETGSWFDYFSFSYSDSGWWIFLQLGWRFLLSLILAFVVFYVAAKPPAPKVSIKVGGIRAFRLGEGVDGSGVTTKLISCNCSVELTIDNNSNLFALHVDPPTLRILFAHLPFATSQGRELYVGSNDITLFRLSVGTRNKAMYGAGRNMQDLLESDAGLPLAVRVNFASRFHVLWGLFASRFRHEAECSVVVSDEYDKAHRTQVYSSACSVVHS